MPQDSDTADFRSTALTATLLAAGYVGLYQLNVFIMGETAFGGLASLVFLPAFVRLLAVLLIGWWAIPTLFVAAWFCVDLSLSPGSQFIVAGALALGAPLAIQSTRKHAGLHPTLSNLTWRRLLLLSFASAFGNGAAYHLGLLFVGGAPGLVSSFPATILGDTVGTWAVIYAIKFILNLVGKIPSRLD